VDDDGGGGDNPDNDDEFSVGVEATLIELIEV